MATMESKDMPLQEQREAMHRFFQSGITLSVKYRQEQLSKLRLALLDYEERLYAALLKDLNKCREEAFFTEISIVLDEIKYAEQHLARWAKDHPIRNGLLAMPSKSYIHYEPLGTALIIAPWNYPINLLLCPLVAAISAGCCAMLKPSPYVPTVSGLLAEMIHKTFPGEYVNLVEGNREVNRQLLTLRWDLIFFTGSPTLGKVVMTAAAQYLTPCILELGGKSPCIIDEDANIEIAARRVAWGKLLNNGQTCIAPDYLLVHQSVAVEFRHAFEIAREDIISHYPIVSIVNEKAADRLAGYENDNKDGVWKDEIFGPILPEKTYTCLDEAIDYINQHEKPLALYFFGCREHAHKVIRHTSSGGAVINDTMLHIVNPNLPFGGVGNSGMGRYHRKAGFLAFSNPKSVLEAWNPFRIKIKEIPFYPCKKIMKYLHKRLE